VPEGQVRVLRPAVTWSLTGHLADRHPTSAYSWHKIPVVDDMERVTEASTLPTLLLGGEAGDRPDEMFTRWQADRTTVIHVETDPTVPSPESEAWWDVPVAEVSALESTRDDRASYEVSKRSQQPALRPARRT
jgi:hypothetical protein